MTPDEIRNILRDTLDDRRLTRGEKRALGSVLHDLAPDDQVRDVYRSVAFDLAREALATGAAKAIVDWLEDVVKALQTRPDSEDRTRVAKAVFSPGDNCPRRIAGLLARTQRTADICVFTITDDRITSAIIDAHHRGLAVRIITDDDKAGDAGSDVDDLARAGIPVRVDRSIYHMHHKFAVFDGDILLTGSYNWTRGAAENNEENFILTSNPKLIRPFAELFEELWRKFGA